MMCIFSPSATMDRPFEGNDCRTEDEPLVRVNESTETKYRSTANQLNLSLFPGDGTTFDLGRSSGSPSSSFTDLPVRTQWRGVNSSGLQQRGLRRSV